MRLSLKEHIQFIKQLAVLLRAGVPILASLRMVKEQSKSKTMIAIMDAVIKDVENGQYLAGALKKFKKIFGELTINIIAIGEMSGNLSNNLDHLALTLKKKQALHRKIIGASVYPIFIVIATLVIAIVLTVFIFPKILPVFKSLNYDLPWTTKFLIFVNLALRNYGALIAVLLALGMVGFTLLWEIKSFRFWFQTLLLRTPFLGRVMQTYNSTGIFRTLGLLLNSGVTVVQSFQIVSETTLNLVYKKELTVIAENIMKGESISANMNKNSAVFPLAAAQMIAVAETTGKLSETFSYLANVYEEELDETTKNLSTMVEPMLLVFMGVLVGFIAISIITPIYGITQHLSPK